MTENAYFFNGTTLGKATLAPYNTSEIASATTAMLGDGVVAGYLNNLVVTPSANVGNISVGTGAANRGGYTYENTAALDVAIDATAATNRIDAVYLEIQGGSRIRVDLTKGVEGAAPSMPAFPAGTLPLAYVYVSSTFNPAIHTVTASNIWDQRLFKQTGYSNQLAQKNLIANSEFMAYSNAATSPDGWSLLNTPTVAQAANFSTLVRGSAVDVTATGGVEGIRTFVTRPPTFNANSIALTLTGLINRVNTASTYISLSTGTTYQQVIQGAAGIYRFNIRSIGPVTNPIVVKFEAADTGNFILGQVGLFAGFTGNLNPVHEIIYFDNELIDANWNTTAKSSGTTTIDLTADFGAQIPYYVRGVIARLTINDSGSAAAAETSLEIRAPGGSDWLAKVDCTGNANDGLVENLAYIPVSRVSNTQAFDVVVTASGAGTLDAKITVIGIIT